MGEFYITQYQVQYDQNSGPGIFNLEVHGVADKAALDDLQGRHVLYTNGRADFKTAVTLKGDKPCQILVKTSRGPVWYGEYPTRKDAARAKDMLLAVLEWLQANNLATHLAGDEAIET